MGMIRIAVSLSAGGCFGILAFWNWRDGTAGTKASRLLKGADLLLCLAAVLVLAGGLIPGMPCLKVLLGCVAGWGTAGLVTAVQQRRRIPWNALCCALSWAAFWLAPG